MIFVSYSSKDYYSVMKWVERIETLGLKCWISDRDCPRTRSDWSEQLYHALSLCDTMLLFLTPNAAVSGQVENEVHNASSNRKNIIPLITEDFSIRESLHHQIDKYEWIRLYHYDETDAWDILRERMMENINYERDQFWNVTSSKEFIEFTNNVMKKYYGYEFFTEINGELYPVYCIEAADLPDAKKITDFDVLLDYDNSKISGFEISDHQSYVNMEWYPEYSRIMEGRIRFPNRPGYMLDEILLDDTGKLNLIRVHVGTYAENVYSTHVLEYELYRIFLEYHDKNLDDPCVWQSLVDSMPIRNRIHQGIGLQKTEDYSMRMKASLLSGAEHDALLSVQMLVILFSERHSCYEVKCIQRSNMVAVKPGVYQFIPSGGFEILNDSDDDIYDDIELEENLSPGCAVFREYLEEAFNAPEFEGNGTGSIEDRLLKDPRIVKIEKLLTSGKATFSFLGSVIDLAGLRHELSFALIVHDEEYSSTRFIANEECKKGKIISIPVSDFEVSKTIWKNIHGPSAAMWELFKRSALFHELTKDILLSKK